MTELANWVAPGMPGNYNAINGYGMNPYDPRLDPRPGFDDGRPALPLSGSSSGTGTAVSFWAANVGTETSGSILSPSNQTLLVGVKPTVGRISRYGIIPITADQDTAGPMARTVDDAAIVLGVLEGARPDARDPATANCPRVPSNDYTRFLRRQGLCRCPPRRAAASVRRPDSSRRSHRRGHRGTARAGRDDRRSCRHSASADVAGVQRPQSRQRRKMKAAPPCSSTG